MTSPTPGPQPSRVYQNHHLDSTRWASWTPRDGDVVVASPYKAGSTWTQQILAMLLGGTPEAILALRSLSVWVEAWFGRGSTQELANTLHVLPDRRVLKTHLPLDGLPFYPQVRYLVVGRDPRDVFMSLFNHYGSYTDFAYDTFNDPPHRVGEPLPRCPDDPRALWKDWICRGWFPWESEGYPFWSNMYNMQTYWDCREEPNLLFLHHSDMLRDLARQARRIARFLGIDASEERIALTVETTTFSNVKRAIANATPPPEAPKNDRPQMLARGLDGFFHRGTNGRWQEILTPEDLTLYEQAKQRVLTPECATWLEHGGDIGGCD
ncbi:MAG: sulfotransferase domain-containing protein [Myxococcota bacterium]